MRKPINAASTPSAAPPATRTQRRRDGLRGPLLMSALHCRRLRFVPHGEVPLELSAADRALYAVEDEDRVDVEVHRHHGDVTHRLLNKLAMQREGFAWVDRHGQPLERRVDGRVGV